ncbi:hypothetical protein GJ496_006852 [Pomphorhynchus laevis]|nr:hypothetical protein GJ496_006852 [Pomphorhynchus laevis]
MSADLNLERDSSRSCTSHPIQNQPVSRRCHGSGHTPLMSQKHYTYTERKLSGKDPSSSQLPPSSFNDRNFGATPDQHSCVLTDTRKGSQISSNRLPNEHVKYGEVIDLARTGNYSKAIRQLTSDGICVSSSSMRMKLVDLHPTYGVYCPPC